MIARMDRAIGTAAGADGSAGLRRENSSPARGDKLAWLAPVTFVSAPPDRGKSGAASLLDGHEG